MLSATAVKERPRSAKNALISLVVMAYSHGVTTRDGRQDTTPVSPSQEVFKTSVALQLTFADRLRKLFPGASVAEIARVLEVPHATVRNYFQDRLPATDILIKLADKTSVSLNWLLTETGAMFVTNHAEVEPGEVPVYLGPKEQAYIRDLAKASGQEFAEEVRGLVIEQLKIMGMVASKVEESNLVFFGDAVRAVEIRLMGEIAAGEPIHAVLRDEKVSVPDFFMKAGKQYMALRVRGDSMIEDGIIDGSLIICEARSTAENGDKVVALVEGDKATVKRIYHEGGRIRLQPANPEHKPIYITPNDRLDIQGVVVGIFHKP